MDFAELTARVVLEAAGLECEGESELLRRATALIRACAKPCRITLAQGSVAAGLLEVRTHGRRVSEPILELNRECDTVVIVLRSSKVTLTREEFAEWRSDYLLLGHALLGGQDGEARGKTLLLRCQRGHDTDFMVGAEL